MLPCHGKTFQNYFVSLVERSCRFQQASVLRSVLLPASFIDIHPALQEYSHRDPFSLLHLFLSFSPCIHFKFQMALMSLGCSSSSICCVSVFAVKEMGKFKRGRVAALDTFIKMLHVSRLNLYK